MLNIGIARVKIPDCCVESHECDDNGSGCSCDMFSDVESTISAERLTIVHNVVPEKLNESKCQFKSYQCIFCYYKGPIMGI